MEKGYTVTKKRATSNSLMQKISIVIFIALVFSMVVGCSLFGKSKDANAHQKIKNYTSVELNALVENDKLDYIIVAGGCFWCIEAAFEEVPDVIEVVSGYTGDTEQTANYEQVTSGKTKHYEAAKIYFDPKKVSIESLLKVYWTLIDPTDGQGQFADKGFQYKSALFYRTPQMQEKMRASFSVAKSIYMITDAQIKTVLLEEMPFYDAEDYHQDYYLKAQERYESYAKYSGRKAHVESATSKLSDLDNVTK
jgi:peptide methionine sulfoxide reductase msrA/msrB